MFAFDFLSPSDAWPFALRVASFPVRVDGFADSFWQARFPLSQQAPLAARGHDPQSLVEYWSPCCCILGSVCCSSFSILSTSRSIRLMSFAVVSETGGNWDGLCWFVLLLTHGHRSHCHTVTLSYCLTVILSYCQTVLPSYCRIVILSYCHTVLPSYGHTVTLSYHLTVILSR